MTKPGVTSLLHELNDEARLFVRNSPDLLCRLNLDGTLGWTNPAWQRWLGWREDELLGKPFDHFLHHDDFHLLVRAVRELQSGDLADLTTLTRFRLRRNDDTYLPCGVRGSAFNGIGRAYLTLRPALMAMAYEHKLEQHAVASGLLNATLETGLLHAVIDVPRAELQDLMEAILQATIHARRIGVRYLLIERVSADPTTPLPLSGLSELANQVALYFTGLYVAYCDPRLSVNARYISGWLKQRGITSAAFDNIDAGRDWLRQLISNAAHTC